MIFTVTRTDPNRCWMLARLMMFMIVALAALDPGGCCAQAIGANPERGQKLYAAKMCYTCHGYAGQGGERGSGPRLVPGLWPYPVFEQQVRRPRQDMPRYSKQFTSDADLANIYAYLASIKPGPRALDIGPLRD